MELNFRCRTRSKGRRIVAAVSCVLWRKFFGGEVFLLLIVNKFHLIKLVLNAFPAISEGSNLKMF